MKKILLSAAVIAVSGVYVVYENQRPASPPSLNASAAGAHATAYGPEAAPHTAKAQMPMLSPRPAVPPQAGFTPLSASPSSGPLLHQIAEIQSAASVQRGYGDGTYRGVSAYAYYGRVQVEAFIKDGRLASIRMLDYPRDRRRSLRIAERSLPMLEREAISAQSARIDAVSGATLTSRAFIKSLDSALLAARAAGHNA